MHLTETWLQQHSSAPSFERGERYHDDKRIRRLIKQGDVYYGEVMGSQLYRQVVDLSGAQPSMTCTCPYSGSGYCKHLVAVGLAILAGEYEQVMAPSAQQVQPEAVDPSLLQEAWRGLPESLKLIYLEGILAKQPALQGSFLRFALASVPPPLQVDRQLTQRELAEALDLVDLASLNWDEPEGDKWDDSLPSWEQGEISLQPYLDRIWAPWVQKQQTLLDKHDWPNAMLLILGLYEGMEQARIRRLPEWEPWSDFLKASFEPLYHGLVDYLALAVISPRLAIWALGQWIQRWQHHDQHRQLNRPSPSITYELSDWRLLLQVLTQDRVSAQFLRTRLDAYQVQGPAAALLYQHIDQVVADRG